MITKEYILCHIYYQALDKTICKCVRNNYFHSYSSYQFLQSDCTNNTSIISANEKKFAASFECDVHVYMYMYTSKRSVQLCSRVLHIYCTHVHR